MMNFTLFKADCKNNAVIFVIVMYVMMMYFSFVTYMFDPTDTSAFQGMVDLLPEGLMAGFGFDQASTNLTSFVINCYYGFLVFMVPLVYCLLVSHRLVVRMVDNGSFAYLLMSPLSRRRIIFTKGCFLLASIAGLFVILTGGGLLVCQILFGNMLNVHVFFQVNINACLLTMVVGMICFFYSCYFNESRLSTTWSAGINIGFLLIFIMGGVSEQAEFLKKFTIYSLLDTERILEGGSTAGVCLLLFVMIVLLFALSIYVFDRKNLSI